MIGIIVTNKLFANLLVLLPKFSLLKWLALVERFLCREKLANKEKGLASIINLAVSGN